MPRPDAPPPALDTGVRGRRRQARRRRLLLSLGLLVAAAALVVVAVLTAQSTWLAMAAVAAVLLGATAVRVVWVEVLLTRHLAAVERVRLVRAHVAESVARSDEHTAVVEALAGRLMRSRRDLVALRAHAEHLRTDLAVARLAVVEEQQERDALRVEVGALRRALSEAEAQAHDRAHDQTHAHTQDQVTGQAGDHTGQDTGQDAGVAAEVVTMAGWSERRGA